MTTPRRRHRQTVDTQDFLKMLGRMLAAASRRVAESDVNDFAELAKVERYVGYAMNLAVAGLRRSGYTWDEIGAAAGTTRQAAHQRWARKVEAA